MSQAPQLENKEVIKEVIQENKKAVNVVDEAAAIIEAAPGRTSEALPLNTSATASVSTASDKTKTGKGSRGPYKKKNRVEAPGVASPAAAPGSPYGQTIPVEGVARMCNQTFETVLIVAMGEDAKLEELEKQTLDASLADYMRIKNYNIPPGLALVMGYFAVVAAKVQKPKPKEKIYTWLVKMKDKISKRNKKDYPTDKAITPKD